jgi:hypothetical protein
MRNNLLLVTALCAGGLAAGLAWELWFQPDPARADAASTSPPPLPAQPEGELYCPEPHADLGLVRTSASHSFTCENRGTVDLRILEVVPKCGCGVAQPEKRLLRPGEKTMVSVTVSSRIGRVEKVTNRVEVTYEVEGKRRDLTLALTSHNRPDLWLPERVELHATKGKLAVKRLSLIDYRDTPLDILALKPSTPDVQAKVVERPTSYATGWKYTLEITYAGSRSPGTYTESVTLRTNDPQWPELRLLVDLRQARRIRVAPEVVRLRGGPGRDPTAQVHLEDVEGEALDIQSVTASHPAIRHALREDGPSRRIIEVSLPEGKERPNAADLSLRVRIQKPCREEICVRLVP